MALLKEVDMGMTCPKCRKAMNSVSFKRRFKGSEIEEIFRCTGCKKEGHEVINVDSRSIQEWIVDYEEVLND